MIEKRPLQGYLMFLRRCHFILSLLYSGEITFMEETLSFLSWNIFLPLFVYSKLIIITCCISSLSFWQPIFPNCFFSLKFFWPVAIKCGGSEGKISKRDNCFYPTSFPRSHNIFFSVIGCCMNILELWAFTWWCWRSCDITGRYFLTPCKHETLQ